MDVLGATGILTRNDGFQMIAPGIVRELMSTQRVAIVIVLAVGIYLPEIQKGVGHGLAVCRQHVASERQLRVRHSSIELGKPFRQIGLEVWCPKENMSGYQVREISRFILPEKYLIERRNNFLRCDVRKAVLH